MSLSTYNPGRLDLRVSLFMPAITGRNAGGAVQHSWTLLGKAWAERRPLTGRETQTADQKLALAEAIFRLRYRTDLTNKGRIVHGTSIYDLVAPPMQIDRQAYLDCVCRSLESRTLTGDAIGMQSFDVELNEGDESMAVVFPLSYGATPSGIYPTLVIPAGGYTFNVVVRDGTQSNTGLTLDFGAAVPGPGYKVNFITTL